MHRELVCIYRQRQNEFLLQFAETCLFDAVDGSRVGLLDMLILLPVVRQTNIAHAETAGSVHLLTTSAASHHISPIMQRIKGMFSALC